jgi:D-alanine transaminase
MISACYRLGISVIERPFTLTELMDADEVIVSSSSNFCLHANQIDGKPVGGKDSKNLLLIQNEVISEYLAYTGKKSLFD